MVFSGDNAGVANGIGSTSRADLVGDPNSGFSDSPIPDNETLVCHPGAFAAPRGLTSATPIRNILRNPNRINFDRAVASNAFSFTERMGWKSEQKAFNVSNHTQWGPVAGDSGSAASNVGASNNTFDSGDSFLRSTSTHNPRILQLGLKFIF